MEKYKMENTRFKLRAWHTKQQKMFYDVSLLGKYLIQYLVDPDGQIRVDVISDNTEDYILMQCTGLTDTHSQDIYENDVIRFHIDFGFGDCPVSAKVVFMNAGFQFESKAGCDYGVSNLGEIAGNMFETPHLYEDNEGEN